VNTSSSLLSYLIEAGKVRPEIDRRYPLGEIPAAIAYLEQAASGGRWSWASIQSGRSIAPRSPAQLEG
jgi:Zinc-binding dehydrogenase